MKIDAGNWRAVVAHYQKADVRRSVTQIFTTLLPLAAMMYLMYLSLSWSYLADPRPRVSDGRLPGPDLHHHARLRARLVPAVAAVEQHRGLADRRADRHPVQRMAPRARDSPRHRRRPRSPRPRGHRHAHGGRVPRARRVGPAAYRLYRNPVCDPGGRARLPDARPADPRAGQVERVSEDIERLVHQPGPRRGDHRARDDHRPAVGAPGCTSPSATSPASAGVYLFFVQHQFDDAYWEHHANWDYATAAVMGCSYLKLPHVLQWFTGNIGLHHVHHLAPRIPNYNLQRAHDENPIFQPGARRSRLAQSVSMLRLALWDEQQKRMVRVRRPAGARSGPETVTSQRGQIRI